MGCCQQQRTSNDLELSVAQGLRTGIVNEPNNIVSPLNDNSLIKLHEGLTVSKRSDSLESNQISHYSPKFLRDQSAKIFTFVEKNVEFTHKKSASALEKASKISKLSLEQLSPKFAEQYSNAKNYVGNNVNSASEVVIKGYNRSASIIQSQVAIIKEGLEDAINSIKDLNLKKRVSSIVYPILRKVFIHSITAQIDRKYKLKEIIGKGSFSIVKRAVDKSSGIDRAVKIIIKNSLDEKQTSVLINEIETLKVLDHPNIIRVIETVEEVSKLCIVTEICTGGELFDRIVQSKTFDELSASRVIYQILSGLIHIHKKGFIHRDLKPENIMYAERDSDTIKIIDFGIAQNAGSEIFEHKNCLGSAYYMAPEIMTGVFTDKCDIWSCGVILFLLLSGTPPFVGRNEQEILNKIQQGVFRFSSRNWKGVSSDAKDLIKKMLTKDVNCRINAKQAWSHPWVQNSVLQVSRPPAINDKMLKNLLNFRKTTKLQKVTLGFIASTMLSNQEIKELRDAFLILDTDGDGHLTELELRRGFEGLSASAGGTVRKVLKSCDIDLNGMIDYTEFLTAACEWQKKLSQEMLEKTFEVIDLDGNGKISVNEIRRFIGEEKNDEIWKKIGKEVDWEDDRDIGLQEFKDIMLKIL